MAARFERAVREEDPEASAIGEKLYKSLFGGMPATVELRPSWLLALDDALFQIPLSALVTGAKAGRPVYLNEKHSLEIVPGAWAVGAARVRVGAFAGLADPVYNSADPRSRGTTASFSLAAFRAHRVEFSRLPSSRQEIEACAREYSGPPPVLLSGWDASRKGLQLALESNPAVLHLATHVVASAETGQEALILLSGTTPGRVDAVTTADILAMRVPGSLVVLSGCGSARGAVLPGAGLLGLSRSWLAAGARGVIASHWKVRDDAGPLFRNFYRHLRQSAAEISPAEALRLARVDVLEAGGADASPSYWSAYEYFGRSN
jgi:CHAT domain-containing protein